MFALNFLKFADREGHPRRVGLRGGRELGGGGGGRLASVLLLLRQHARGHAGQEGHQEADQVHAGVGGHARQEEENLIIKDMNIIILMLKSGNL